MLNKNLIRMYIQTRFKCVLGVGSAHADGLSSAEEEGNSSRNVMVFFEKRMLSFAPR